MTRIHAFGDDCLGDLDAVGVAERIAKKEISPLEATEAALARIDAVNGTINGIAHEDRERALARAEANAFSGVFAGVPTLIKNNTNFVGIPTTHGSAAVPPIPAAANEPFTQQLMSTGVNVLAASTLPAFGLTASTEFVDREPTRNPWNPDYSAGASSGGSAALVAAGAVPIAHANDGGGSIRIPAASCGLVGLKPTQDRTVPAQMTKDLPVDIVTNGIVSRTVRDSAYFLAAAEKYLPNTAMPQVGLVEGPSKRRLRIGLVRESIVDATVDEETSRALQEIADLLVSLGHTVVDIPVPVPKSFINDFTLYWGLMAMGIVYGGKFSVSPGFDKTKIDPLTNGIAQIGRKNLFRLPKAVLGIKRSRDQYREVAQEYDLIMSPTLLHTTPKLGWLDPGVEFETAFRRLVDYVAFTPLNNAAGGPAVSLPLAQTKLGLPIGIHFSADHGRERTLLELAYELEEARPFARIQD